MAYSAAALAAIAALFNPLPALAAPGAPQVGSAPAVPDAGSRPIPLGTLVMPGQVATTTTTTAPTLTGVAGSPVLQKIEKGRAEIATLGDQLIQLGQDRDLAHEQETTAQQSYQQSEGALRIAQTAAADAAAEAVLEAAALPPGTNDSGLLGLDDLANLQRGQGASSEAAARQLDLAQTASQLTLDTETLAEQHYTDMVGKYDKLNRTIGKKQQVQQKLEQANEALLIAAETAESAADSRLGALYLAGAEAGRGADPRALTALEFALAQRGKPYVWSTEGLDSYDCSGLVWRAYKNAGALLPRVSRDQYEATDQKVVDRYSLLPGDLLFFSYSNSWRGIHHVAMYAGNGMMVEAPRTGLNVRLVPVRWTLLFQATRVFGSVPGGSTEPPNLGSPDPEPTESTTTPTTPGPRPTTPKPSPSTTKSTSPSPSPSHPHSSPPSSSPTKSSSPPSSSPPSTNPTPSASASSNGVSTSPSSSSSASISSSASVSSSSSSSAAATGSSSAAGSASAS